MPVSSMTGFARAQGQTETCTWTWEVKSVNGKGLDVRCRLPYGFDGLEAGARERVGKRFRRGSVGLALNVMRDKSGGSFRLNREMLHQVLSMLPEIEQQLPGTRPPSADGLLALRGIIEPADEDQSEEARQALEQAMLASLDEALDSMAAMRNQEGERLGDVLEAQLDAVAGLCNEAEGLAAMQPGALLERLRTQVAALLEAIPALPEERLVQDAVLLAAKADIREELDRLAAHIAAARALLGEGGVVGRKLDFLCQEFNREANTLCSKSADVELTRVGLALKSLIEQFREQVQNIE